MLASNKKVDNNLSLHLVKEEEGIKWENSKSGLLSLP